MLFILSKIVVAEHQTESLEERILYALVPSFNVELSSARPIGEALATNYVSEVRIKTERFLYDFVQSKLHTICFQSELTHDYAATGNYLLEVDRVDLKTVGYSPFRGSINSASIALAGTVSFSVATVSLCDNQTLVEVIWNPVEFESIKHSEAYQNDLSEYFSMYVISMIQEDAFSEESLEGFRVLLQESTVHDFHEIHRVEINTLSEDNITKTDDKEYGDETPPADSSVKLKSNDSENDPERHVMLIISGLIGGVGVCIIIGICFFRNRKGTSKRKYPMFPSLYQTESSNTKSTSQSLRSSPLATMIGLDDEIELADDASSADFTYTSTNYFQQPSKSQTNGFTENIMSSHDIELMRDNSLDLSSIEVVVDRNESEKNEERCDETGGASRSRNRSNSRDSIATSSTISDLEYPHDSISDTPSNGGKRLSKQMHHLGNSSGSISSGVLEQPIEDNQRRVWNAIRIDSKRLKRLGTEGGVLDSFDEKADSSSILTEESDIIAELRRIDSDIWKSKETPPKT